MAIGIDNRLWRLFNGAVIEPCVTLNGFNVKFSVYCLAFLLKCYKVTLFKLHNYVVKASSPS